jgi:hypothetical protein
VTKPREAWRLGAAPLWVLEDGSVVGPDGFEVRGRRLATEAEHHDLVSGWWTIARERWPRAEGESPEEWRARVALEAQACRADPLVPAGADPVYAPTPLPPLGERAPEAARPAEAPEPAAKTPARPRRPRSARSGARRRSG